MNDADFDDVDEQMEWLQSKVDVDNVEHPPKLHKNWKLSEYWFEHDQGAKTTKVMKIDEELSRVGKESGAANSMMSLDDLPQKGKGKDMAAKHKAGLGRVVSLCGKLGKAISSTENNLPGWKRKTPPGIYSKLKAGVERCRQCRAESLDEMEDLKDLPEEEHVFDEFMGKLAKIQTNLQEHIEAIKEATSLAEPTVKQQHEENDGDGDARTIGVRSHQPRDTPPQK